MDFEAIFSKDEVIKARFRGVDTAHTLREPTTRERIDFSKATATARIDKAKGGIVSAPSDAALQAPVKLYDAICTKVEIENGDGVQALSPDEMKRIPDDLKIAIIGAWQRRIEIDEGETLGN